jgi:hypothetical protein
MKGSHRALCKKFNFDVVICDMLEHFFPQFSQFYVLLALRILTCSSLPSKQKLCAFLRITSFHCHKLKRLLHALAQRIAASMQALK